jgi:pilus assembly protein Flp/PilA
MLSQAYRSVVRFLREEEAHSALEYAVQMALILVACIHIVQVLSADSTATFNNVSSHLTVSS